MDFRPTHDKVTTITFIPDAGTDPEHVLSCLDTTRPIVTYDGPPTLRDSRELLSECSGRLPAGAKVLDLGCGPRDQARAFEHLGHKYVGLDAASPSADIFSDAHVIAFRDATFDCVFSYAVLEHLRNPHLAIREVERVLKPGGFFIGTASQGEPFHSSYFHFTPWGLISLVEATRSLRLIRMWESEDTLASLAHMGRYPRLIKGLIGLIHRTYVRLPFLAPRRMRWSDKARSMDRLYRAGSLCFVVDKRGS